jgi:hypothetical protein
LAGGKGVVMSGVGEGFVIDGKKLNADVKMKNRAFVEMFSSNGSGEF